MNDTMPPFERVVTDHGPRVLRVCRALLGRVDAEDAWADTFLAALRAYPSLAADSNVAGWLVTIAYRTSIDHLRRRNRRPIAVASPADAAATVDVVASPVEAAAAGVEGMDDDLRAALARLPDKQRRGVVYRHLGDLAYDDVARLLECSPAAARRNVADGIAALRRTYAPRPRKDPL